MARASLRIETLTDVKLSQGQTQYLATWNSPSEGPLIYGISGPDLGVSFAYAHNQALKAAFAGAQQAGRQFGTVSLLTGMTNAMLRLSQTFTYGTNESAELLRATEFARLIWPTLIV